MEEKREIFRKVSLERLSSPEQLDQLMTSTSPVGWMALLGVVLLLIPVIIWGFAGNIYTKTSGKGILIRSGGVYTLQHVSGGKITKILVNRGQMIKAGEVIALLAQPELEEDIANEKINMETYKKEKEYIEEYIKKNIEMQKIYLRQEKENIMLSIKTIEEQLKFLETKIKSEETLLEKGLITKESSFNTKQQYNSAVEKLAMNKNNIKELEMKEIEIGKSRKEELDNTNKKIENSRQRIAALKIKNELNSKIISTHGGRVLEVIAEEGSVISGGSEILTLEQDGINDNELEAVIYVPAREGKKIKKGMKVSVELTIIKKEEFGYINGIVKSFSEFPATRKGMMKVLGNESLVASLSSEETPIEVFVTLNKSGKTVSGFEWSSPKGPAVKLQSGTLCTGYIIIDKQPPVSLVIPWMKAKLLQ